MFEQKGVLEVPKVTFFFVVLFWCLGISQYLYSFMEKSKILRFSQFKQPRNCLQLTRAKLSEYKLITENINAEIIQGDYFNFKLTTFDTNGSPKASGGDFIYAIMHDSSRKLSTAGHVEDNNDGSYTVTFYAPWSGKAEIRMTLVHPSLAVSWLKDVYQPAEKKIAWIARFRKWVKVLVEDTRRDVNVNISCTTVSEEGDKNSSANKCANNHPSSPSKNGKKKKRIKSYANSSCTIVSHRNLSGNNCVYAHPSGLGETVAICSNPPEFLCENLFDLQSNFSYINTRVNYLLTSKAAQLFKRPFVMEKIEGWPSTIFIREKTGQDTKDVSPNLIRSRCGPNLDVPKTLISGFWRKKSWISFSCNSSQHWDESRAYNCLKNKEVLLFGDSTTRQWIYNLGELLNLNLTFERKEKTYKMLQSTIYNVSVSFRFHSWNFYAETQRQYSTYKFEVDIIDGLPRDHCNFVIVVSLWAHFCFWPIKSYVERLTLIRESLVRLLQDCPYSQIVIKGSHPRDHPFFEANIHSSDWLLYDMNRVMREVFQGINAIFLDVWDMNLAYLAPNTIHMPDTVIDQEIALFLSYICPNKSD